MYQKVVTLWSASIMSMQAVLWTLHSKFSTKGGKKEMQNGGFKWLIGLMTLGLMMAMSGISQARPGANVLIADTIAHRVIEVDPVTNTIVWQYGQTYVPGSGPNQLNYPHEAIPRTNGNILIADTGNSRVIEVTSDTRQIVWQYPTQYTPTLISRPVDVRECIDYTTGASRNTVLITDYSLNEVMEIIYPDGAIVWRLSAASIGISGEALWEAEKRPGAGTPTYLITSRVVPPPTIGGPSGRVMVVERTGPTSGTIIWQYTGLVDPRDALWLPCGTVLITETGNSRVIEVDPTNNSIVWEYNDVHYKPLEAIRIENYNTLMVGVGGQVSPIIPPDPGVSPIYHYTDAREIIQGTSIIDWSYSVPGTGSSFLDVEEKGIINIAKILYKDGGGHEMKKVFAGVVVPIYQPEIIAPPEIVATKTVTPTGPQRPGATLTYTVTITNTGTGTATNIRIIDQIPEGTVYVVDSATVPPAVDNTEYSHDGGLTYDLYQTAPVTHIRWTINNLAPGASRTVNFSVVIR